MASQHPSANPVSASLLVTTVTFVKFRRFTSLRNSFSFSSSISVAYTRPVGITLAAASNENCPSPAPMSATTVPAFHSITFANRAISSAALAFASQHAPRHKAAVVQQTRPMFLRIRFMFLAPHGLDVRPQAFAPCLRVLSSRLHRQRPAIRFACHEETQGGRSGAAMRKLAVIAAVLLVLACASPTARTQQSSSPTIVLRIGTDLDGRGHILRDTAIVISDGK